MNKFIVSWDQTGLDGIFPCGELAAEAFLDKIAGRKSESQMLINKAISMMMHRARANGQRHYEIYVIESDDGITGDDIKELFATDPQYAADLCRERGTVLFDERQKDDDKIRIR